ncbi:MAG TPA: DUF1294 domain-containing protein [Flavobacterium sp.]
MNVLLYCFLGINCLAFLVTAYDKRLAIKNRRRISEKTLLSFVAFGGTIGAALAMVIFRHKTSKKSYLLKFTGIVVLQMLLSFTAYSIKL